MRRAVLSCALLLLAACSKKEVPAGALKIALSFQGFGPGCVDVTAQDGSGHHASTQLTNVARDSSKVVALEGSWGAGLTVTATAWERTCEVQKVAQQTQSTSVPSTGVGSLSLSLSAPDVDGDGYVAMSAGGTDCDDSPSGGAIHPGAVELCNGKDDNCDGQLDEGLPSQPYFRDQDHDGYGVDATRTTACQSPGSGWAAQGGDCNDSPDGGATIHPNATEQCNGVDDNCDGTIDEPFFVGDACLSSSCVGTFQCKGLDASTCVTPAYYADLDGDGHGAGAALSTCPVGGSVVTNNDDCDDGDPTTYPDAGDVCDQRINNCTVGGSPDPSCPGAKWAAHVADAGTNGWNTASVSGAAKVWFAGTANVVSLHTDAGFTDFSSACTTGVLSGNWHASWGDGTGTVYLGGEDTAVAGSPQVVSVSATGTCSAVTGFTGLSGIVYGLEGFPGSSGPDLFAASDNGHIYRNDGTSVAPSGSQKLLGIHGTSATNLIAVGQAKVGSGSGARLVPAAYKRGTSGWANMTVDQVANLPAAATTLRGVFVLDASHAYLVGEAGTLLYWDGNVLTAVAPPPDATSTTSFNSVIAFSPSSVYVVDSDGKIRRFNGTGWETPPLASMMNQPLNAITGWSTSDLWVAGLNDLTLHWHEP